VSGIGDASGIGQSLSKGKGNLRVMTYNVDEGTDYLEVQQATNVSEFLVAVGQTITQVRATDSPSRMQAWEGVPVHWHASGVGGPEIREAQGGELRAGPANTSLPVILAMDSNAPAFPLPQDPTYPDFIAARYNDAWTEIFPLVPGFTCCLAQFDNNPVSDLYQRIDLILTRGNIEAQNIALFGADPATKTPGGLWPSDHAGVAAQLVVEEE